jgi:hypothetical protein
VLDADHGELFLPLAALSNVLLQVVDGPRQHLQTLAQRLPLLQIVKCMLSEASVFKLNSLLCME